jgi:hypothetical protein
VFIIVIAFHIRPSLESPEEPASLFFSIMTKARLHAQNLTKHPDKTEEEEEDDPRVGGLWRNAPR